MAITSNINRIASTLAAMIQTRLELVSVELEEELVRFSSYFVYSLVALYCAAVAVTLGIVLVIVLYWDDHRFAVLATLIVVFAAASAAIAEWLRQQFLNKPRLLEHSLAEMKKDVETIHSRSADSDSDHFREQGPL